MKQIFFIVKNYEILLIIKKKFVKEQLFNVLFFKKSIRYANALNSLSSVILMLANSWQLQFRS